MENSPLVVESGKVGDLSMMQYLIGTCNCDPNSTVPPDNYTALYWAACNNHAHVVKYLVNLPAVDVNQPIATGSTPLHAAAERGNTECVYLLCKNGANINLKNINYHDTPLHLAAYRGHRVVCKILLDYGANLQIRNVKGRTCMDEAKNQSHNEVYSCLCHYKKGQLSDDTIFCVYRSEQTIFFVPQCG